MKSIKAMPLALHKFFTPKTLAFIFLSIRLNLSNNQQFVPNFLPKLLDSCILLYTYLTTATGS